MATKLDLADAQFIGFHHGQREGAILGMVQSMGLTAKEWEKWKKEYTTTYLTDDEVEEIDEYFKGETLTK